MISRAGWGAKAPKSRTSWNVANLEGICQHWFGSPRAASTHAGCDDLLRSVQRGHMAPGGLGVPTGGSDIAYNFGVCPHGETYELRGWNTQTGANGTTDANRRFIAFVYMAGTGNPFTPEAEASLRALYKQAFAKGVAERVVTHGSITGSECPGPVLTPWVNSGAWKQVEPPPVTRWKVEYGPWNKRGSTTVAISEEDQKTPSLWVKRHPGVFQQRGGPIIFRPK